jgi:hypothetical protein
MVVSVRHAPMLRAHEPLPSEPSVISLGERLCQRQQALEIPMERPSLVDSTIAENGVLNQAKNNAWQTVTDMRAACDGDAVPMRDDLHQRFPSDRQLLDLEVSGRSLEVSHQVTLREFAGR